MEITYLGHAGFLLETDGAIVVADPWLSPEGAFDSAWMQLPRNHQLAPWVRERLADSTKERFIYVSHEHRDHFDPWFLASLADRGFTLVIARFRRKALRAALEDYRCARLAILDDGERLDFAGGYLRLFVDDSGLNRDSALFVRGDGQSFLDLNDCKIHDRVGKIREEEGALDLFTAQFSGAIWHPTCYDYDRATYAAISRRKSVGKFEAVSRAIEQLAPRFFMASAGPVCFLDPSLIHLNYEEVSIFPRAPRFFAYVKKRLRNSQTQLLEPMPGDRLELATGKLHELGEERVDDDSFPQYVALYAKERQGLYRARLRNRLPEELEETHAALRAELERKLAALELRERVLVPLYAWLEELPSRVLRVDFARGVVEEVAQVPEQGRYTLCAAAADLRRVLDRKMTWDEFLLSFRLRLSREPDTYDAILHGFLAVEAEDLGAFCDTVRQSEARQERITVEAGGVRYSVRRYCPHQGADLTQAWCEGGRYLVCPRHRWRFDLKQGGACTTNGTTLNAVALENDEAQCAGE